MRISAFLKFGLLLYECIRVVILAFLLLFFGNNPGISIIIITIASGALFPLMAFFIWMDINRYRAYLPLLIAGKVIGIVILMLWSITTKQVTIIETIILSGDLFSVAAVLLIIRDLEKPEEIQSISDTPTGG